MGQPELDEALVERLAKLADRLDGGDRDLCGELLEEFNTLAGTSIPFEEFQGIYGGEEHVEYVRRVLTAKQTTEDPTLDRNGLVEMFSRILADPCDNAYLTYAFSTIEKTYGDSQVSDLVFWPNEYFGDGDLHRELTPEMMADAVIERSIRSKGSDD
jgi:hypothetical protein